METESLQWAQQQFSGAKLGDRRLTKRLVRVASEAEQNPAGTVTQVCRASAEREGAFRLLENPRVDVAAVGAAHHQATARQCAEQPQVIVPIDQTSLTVTDRQHAKELGPSGYGRHGPTRQMQVMNALALERDGTPVGLIAQHWWTRSGELKPKWKHDRRTLAERESVLWHDALRTACEHLAAEAPATQPWFQLDAGADIWHVLQLASDEGLKLTVRSAYDRCLSGPKGEPTHLHQRLAQAPLKGEVKLHVPRQSPQAGGRTQPARTAVLALRACTVPLRLRDYGREVGTVEMTAVSIDEPHPPDGIEPLHWLLLSTQPVECFDDAMEVVRAYALRWRVEDFHRCWKSGACGVERSQLRHADTLRRWATILAAVATRIERLKHRARNEPDVPAIEELSRAELDAAIMLAPDHPHRPGAELTLREAVTLIARVGGYTGRASDGPPGSQTLHRGLDRVTAAATALTQLPNRRSDE